VGPFQDDAAVLPLAVVFAALASVGYAILVLEVGGAGFLDFVVYTSRLWLLPAAFVAAIVYTGLLVQVLQIRPTVLTMLLLWIVPLLVAAVISAGFEGLYTVQAVTAALSPIALVVMSGVILLDGAVPVEAQNEFSAVLTGIRAGLVFFGVQIAVLSWRWVQLKRNMFRRIAPR
jgi:hypothetical protein